MLVLLAAAVVSARAAEQTASLDPASEPAGWQVYQIFHASCAECHGGHLAKPKAKLGYILDLPRLVEEEYITPGDPEHSQLFQALVSADEDEHMPPLDSDGPQLTAAEIEIVRAWIAAGAPVREAQTPAPTDANAAENATPEKAGLPPGRIAGRLHPLVVHFPIALLLAATLAELGSRLRPAQAAWLQGATRACLWIAAAGAAAAAGSGWLNAMHEGYAAGHVDVHRWLGVGTAALTLLALITSELTERAALRVRRTAPDALPRAPRRGWLLAALLVCTILVVLAGHTGGVIAYGEDYLSFW